MQKKLSRSVWKDYLLKPVTSAQLLEAIRRIAEKIYGRRGRQEETKNEKEQKTLTKRRLFRHIVSGEHSFSEVLKEAREQEIELAAERYNVLMLRSFSRMGRRRFMKKMKHLKIIWNSFLHTVRV